MNVTIYIFGNFADGYSQYPDNFTRDLFEFISKSRKGATELVYHRDKDLAYYIYTREVSRSANTFIGLCYVFNGVFITNLAYLFKSFEDAIENIVYKGELLELSNDGVLSTKIRQLYTNAEELQRISEHINTQLSTLDKYAMKLPPLNYAISKSEWKTFSYDQIEQAQKIIKNFSDIRVIKGDNYDTDSLKTVAHKLKKQNDEIKTLKEDISHKDNKISELERQLDSQKQDKTSTETQKNIEKKDEGPVISQSEPPKPPILLRVVLAIMIVLIFVVLGTGAIYQISKRCKHHQQVETEYRALKDSCNMHFKQGRYEECRQDIEEMKKIEEKNTWLKSFSDSYSNTLDSLESKRQRIPKTN